MFFRTFASEMMTKDEIISNLMEQLKATNEQNAALINRVAELTAQLKEALARLESIEQSVKQKDETIRKEKNKNKGLTTLLEKDSEQQKPRWRRHVPSGVNSAATTGPGVTATRK